MCVYVFLRPWDMSSCGFACMPVCMHVCGHVSLHSCVCLLYIVSAYVHEYVCISL